jgi:hypothetical protein
MTTDFEAAGSWERVAAELRACRESQQRAWGDIDNATLGRYLAGELSGEDRRQVEQALEALPELRKLTDLVRDVLADCEPEVAPARTLTPAPEPMSRRQPRPALLRFRRHTASLVSLATAASLLLALGLSMPRLGDDAAARAPSAPALGRAVATRGESPVFFTALRPTEPALSRPAPAREEGLARIEQMDRTVWSLEQKGKRKEALALAQQYPDVARRSDLEQHPRYAYSLNQVCQLYLEDGDLKRAEESLQQALALSKRELGTNHPVTVWARNRLAGVYQVALNTPATDGLAVRSVGSREEVAPAVAQPLTAAPPAPAPAPPFRGGYMSKDTPGAAGGNPYEPFRSSSMKVASDGKVKAEQARALHEQIVRLDPHKVRTVVVPVLTKALEESASSVERLDAARALGQLGPAARDAAPALVFCLRHARTQEEGKALAGALVQIGPSARDALQNLDRRARDGDPVLEVWQRLQGREGRIGVNDAGECFSVRALRRSAQEIHALAERAQVELMVETAPALRPDAVQDAKQRLGEMGPRGVCVLIGKDGPDVRVWASEDLRRQGLPTEKLAQAVTDLCRRRQYDAALAQAVHFVRAATKK